MEKKYECCECGWTGLHSEKDQNPSSIDSCMTSDVCPNCGEESFYEIENQANNNGDLANVGSSLPSSDAIQFGNWLNRNAEKWGDEWVLDDGRNYTTAQLYKRFKILTTPVRL